MIDPASLGMIAIGVFVAVFALCIWIASPVKVPKYKGPTMTRDDKKAEMKRLIEWHETQARHTLLDAQRYPTGPVKKSLEDISSEHRKWANLIREMII